MGKLTEEQLDELFRSQLKGLEGEPSKEGWAMLAKSVKRQNFFTFGWKHFNVFFAASILVIILAIFTIGFKNEKKISSSVTIPLSDSTKTNTSVQSESINTPIPVPKESPILNKKRKSKISLDSSIYAQKIIITESTVTKQTIKDTPQIVSPPIVTSEISKPKTKKIITLVKRDTVLVKDTVTIKRKKKRQ